MQYQEKVYIVNGIRLHVIEAGASSDPVVIFLHGFPEFWYAWRHQIAFFTNVGYRVVVPDLRGYNLSDKPTGVAAYTLPVLVQDCRALISALQASSLYLVGHDWGAAIAWKIAEKYPELLNRLVILNLPHPKVFMQTLKNSIRQLLKSWYIGFFQIPVIPEKILTMGNYALLEKALTCTSLPGTFTEETISYYKNAWKQSGALRAMIHWYRAIRHNPGAMEEGHPIRVPTLLLWGARDVALRSEMAHKSILLCEKGKLILREDATHWIHHEKSDFVNAQILEFFRQTE